MGAISTKFHRQVMLQAKPLCRAVGGECRMETGRGKHGKIVISIKGKQRKTPISSTPRVELGDAVAMKLADIRRILREMMQ